MADRRVRRQSPGATTIWCCSTRPRSSVAAPLDTARRSQLAEISGYGYCKSHSRWFWGMRLHLACAADGTPRAAALVAADRPEREIALAAAPSAPRRRDDRLRQGLRRRRVRPSRPPAWRHDRASSPQERNRPSDPSRADPATDRVGLLHLQRPALARTPRRPHPRNLYARIATRLLALAACISLNHRLGRPAARSPTTPPNPWHQSSSPTSTPGPPAAGDTSRLRGRGGAFPRPGKVELSEDRAHVRLDGLLGQPELLRDTRVGSPSAISPSTSRSRG